MLQLKNLTLTHKKDLRPLVSDLSVVIHAGDKVAIIGEEGNGKSALLKVVAGLSEVDSYLTVEGEVINPFQQVAYLPQNLSAQTLSMPIYEFIFGDLDLNDLDYGHLAKLLGQLGLSEELIYAQRSLKTLSGGQKIKVQLFKLLLVKPDLLLLDEPSNDLDLKTLLWLENFIKTSEQTIMFVSHDRSLLSTTATIIIHLESLKHKSQAKVTVAQMAYQTYVATRESERLKQSQVAQQEQMADQKRMEELSRVKQKVHHQLIQAKDSATGRLLAKKMKNLKSREKRYARERQDFTAMPIKEEQIRLNWSKLSILPKTKSILSLSAYDLRVEQELLVPSLDFQWFGQEKVGIIGSNGIGKSVFLGQVWQLLKNKSGIRVNYMAQDYLSQLDEEVSPFAYLSSVFPERQEAELMTYLGSLCFLAEEMLRPIASLSGGQRAKLLVASLVLSEANVLILDEPTRNLSPLSTSLLQDKLKEYSGALLLVSHDREFLRQTCDKVYELDMTGLKEVKHFS